MATISGNLSESYVRARRQASGQVGSQDHWNACCMNEDNEPESGPLPIEPYKAARLAHGTDRNGDGPLNSVGMNDQPHTNPRLGRERPSQSLDAWCLLDI